MVKDICEICDGTGEVSCMETVYKGEPHMADIGSEPCQYCSSRDRGEDYDEEN